MNCIDCRYNLIKDGHSKCTYDEGECVKVSVLEKENAELKEDLRNKKLAIQNRNGRIKELEEKISVLLSCANCPENKGGYICEKEYEDKCLPQKIQYIKELQEEIAELKDDNKANEWHFVKDGDLPPLDTNVLVIHRWAKTPEVGKRIKVFINSSVWVWAMCSDRFRYTSDDENVIAWKEIVLPKEKE